MVTDTSRRRLLLGLGACALAGPLAACGGGDLGAQARYERVVRDALARYRLPGVLAGVRVAGQTVWAQAFGLASVEAPAAMSLDSHFPIRSVTKSFTVTALLQLARDGLLSLDHTIGRYIPGVPNGDRITLAQMAGNQSGLADYSAQQGFLDIFVADTLHVFTPQELAAFSLSQPPKFEPGTQYQYSNTNTVLLGMVIEQVSGQPLGQVLATRIFNPLGLRGTSYPSSATLPAPMPTPYAVDFATGATEAQPLISPSSLAGSGAMASTLADLLVWGEELGRGSLIGPALLARRKGSARAATNGPEYDDYGLGLGRIGAWWGHTGSGVGFQIATMNLAGRDVTVSVLVNASPSSAPRRDFNYAQELFEALAAEIEAA